MRGGKGHLSASHHSHPSGLRVPLWLAAVPPSPAGRRFKLLLQQPAVIQGCDTSKQAD